MAFTPATFTSMSSMANSDTIRHWCYTHATDSEAEMDNSGYFDGAVKYGLKANDIIWAVGDTGSTATLTAIHIAANTAGVITTTTSVLTLA